MWKLVTLTHARIKVSVRVRVEFDTHENRIATGDEATGEGSIFKRHLAENKF